MKFLKKETKNRVTVWSSNPTPGHISGENLIWKDTCTPVFTAGLFPTAKTWKQTKCPSTEERIKKMCFCCSVAKSCLTLCDLNGLNTGVSSHSLLQGIFLTPGSNWGLFHCRQILYHLSHQRKKESEVAQLCPTLCDPIDYSLPGSSVHGIFQAIVLEWMPFKFTSIPLCMGYHSGIKKELNNTIFSNMDGPRYYPTKLNKSDRQKHHIISLICGI